jgi:hypothetical protein
MNAFDHTCTMDDMPNSLEAYIDAVLRDDETTVMNILCEHCPLVSDEAIYARDVHNTGQVVSWIERNPHFFRRGLVKTKKR